MQSPTIHVKVDDDTYRKFAELAKEENRSKNNLARIAIEFYLRARKKLK